MRTAPKRLAGELLLLTAAAVVAFAAAALLDLSESFTSWSRRHEDLNLDELSAVSVVVMLGLGLIGWRRHREAQAGARLSENASESLSDITDKYQSLFTHNPHAAFSLDPEGRFVSTNHAGEVMTGYSEAELLGVSFTEIMDSQHLEETIDLFLMALSGTSQAMNTAIFRSTGERIDVAVKASPVVVNGTVVGVYGVGEDITATLKMERDLQRTQAAVAAAMDGVLVGDEDHRIAYANAAARRLHGCASAEEMVGQRMDSFLDASESRGSEFTLRSLVGTSGRWTGHLLGRRVDDTTFVAETSISMLPDGCLVAIGRDVTARVEAETALALSEERHRLLARVTREVIWDTDLGTERVTLSGAIRDLFGFTDETIEVDGEWWRLRVHPDDVADVLASVFAAFESTDDQWVHEYRLRDHAENYLTVLARGLIIRDQDGTAIRFVGSLMDITQRRRQEEELRVAHRAAEKATEAKSLFLANMSHEIRTPLTTVIGGTEMMLDSPLSPNQEKLMGRVHRAGERLLKLVDDLLDFSKIEAGQIRVDTLPFDPAAVVQQTALWAQDACAEKGLEFRLTMPDTISQQLMGDPHRLGQILTNLIGNAVKFTSSGHVHLTVLTVGETARSRRLSFTVEDTGPGISPDHQTHIFQPFSQADPSITRHFGGSGLGLAIAKDIVESMGGTLGVDSRPGHGSRFFFEVPFAVPSAQFEATRTA